MQLYQVPASPYVRKVLIVAHEHNLTHLITPIAAPPNPHREDHPALASNPLSKIPTLVLEDGTALYDSRVICEYLDTLGRSLNPAGPTLFPTDPTQKWRNLQLVALADGMMDAGVSCLYERRFRPVENQYPQWIDAQWRKIERGFDWLEGEAQAGRLNGVSDMTMGEIGVVVALDKFGKRKKEDRVEERWPGLGWWAEEYRGREGFRATVPEIDFVEI
ncbi:hypothetical protein HDV00_010902 [Rhizophlyctis rosea]|nr:hypothetical protein HDV00_010902 [Rhizophlyctis rosea]